MQNLTIDKLRSSRGMTLVELLFVMAILSVVMMAVMSLYVPLHQSTVSQTQVTDVQSNLRLALKTMSKDLLVAGFLVQNIPIAFPDVAYGTENLDTPGTQSSSEFIIRTRSVGSGFARVSGITSVTPGVATLEVVSSEMLEKLPVGSKVRLFKPGSFTEVKENPAAATDSQRVYEVAAGTTGATLLLDVSTNSLEAEDIEKETVVVRVKDSDQPPLQTIHYYLEDGALVRHVNENISGGGSKQLLARGLDAVEFDYFPPGPSDGRYNHVNLKLVGKTVGLKNDAISGAKTREVKSSVKLRNTL